MLVQIIWIILHFVYWLCTSINSCWEKNSATGVGWAACVIQIEIAVGSKAGIAIWHWMWHNSTIVENNNNIISISDFVSSSQYQTEVWTDSERRRWGSIPQNATISTQQQWYTLLHDNNTHNSNTIHEKRFPPSPKCYNFNTITMQYKKNTHCSIQYTRTEHSTNAHNLYLSDWSSLWSNVWKVTSL